MFRWTASKRGNNVTRHITVTRTIEPHQGSCVDTWQNSSNRISKSVGPYPVPNPSCAKSPNWWRWLDAISGAGDHSWLWVPCSRILWASVDRLAMKLALGRIKVGRDLERIGWGFWINLANCQSGTFRIYCNLLEFNVEKLDIERHVRENCRILGRRKGSYDQHRYSCCVTRGEKNAELVPIVDCLKI